MRLDEDGQAEVPGACRLATGTAVRATPPPGSLPNPSFFPPEINLSPPATTAIPEPTVRIQCSKP